MIKAETIIHEGNPGPNWLDRCRSLATPGKATAGIIVVAVLAVLVGVTHQSDDKIPTSSASQQPQSAGKTLQVQPLLQSVPTTSTGEATVQQATGGTTEPTAVQDNTSISNQLGAKSTPSLNNTNTPAAATQNSTTSQSQLNGKTLTNTVQSTLQNLDDSLKRTNDTVKDSLKNGLNL